MLLLFFQSFFLVATDCIFNFLLEAFSGSGELLASVFELLYVCLHLILTTFSHKCLSNSVGDRAFIKGLVSLDCAPDFITDSHK